MTITRHGITQATEGLPLIPIVPIISRVVVRGDTVYVDHKNPPVRACVRADLWHPGLLVEIMVTAAK